MRKGPLPLLVLTLLVTLAACAAPTSAPTSNQPGQPAQSSAPRSTESKTVTMAVRYEVSDLAAKTVAGGPSSGTKRAFNAALALIDGKGTPQPYLAESLPTLNSESWKVTADGKMETTWKLKPNLTWHDGTPLTADDFAFAYKVYTAPGLGMFVSKPQDQIEDVSAPDPRTIVMRWKVLYPDAGSLVDGDLDPLPRHILEGPFNAYLQDAATMDAFVGQPFWTTQFVGPGPYKLVRWDQGSSIEGTAFDAHILGRPKIDHFVVKFVPDENTAMTNMLAGAINIGVDNSLRFEHAMQLRQQWEAGQRGTALLRPGTRHWMVVQFRNDFLKTTALSDLRVRQAMMHAIDRSSLNEALFEGQGLMSEHFVPREMPYYDDVQQAITKYAYDPRRVEQLMTEAGFSRGTDGTFTRNGERLNPEVMTDGGGLFERELSLVQQDWGKTGIPIEPKILPAVQVRDNQARNTFPDLYITSTGVREGQLDIFSSASVGTPNNRWAGSNRGGWISPEYERIWNQFNTTLERPERNRQVVALSKLLSDQVPGLPLYFNIGVVAFTSNLKGPEIGTPESLFLWNMHEWTMS